jgi:RimJ/RimL family protein N-acetyltransferase
MIPLIEPTTERLLLRQWRDDDFDAFARLSSDPVAMEFFPKCLDREESDVQAEKYRQRIIHQGWGFWAVELVGGDPFIGFVGLNRPDASLPISPCVEIGWRMLPAYWGKGYASEAARAALRVGFEQLDLEEIVSFTATINVRSQRVMQRLGMHHDGEKFDHPWLADDSPLKEHVVYRLSRKEWLRSEGA